MTQFNLTMLPAETAGVDVQELLVLIKQNEGKLKKVGEYVILTTEGEEPKVLVVTEVNRTRGWADCNKGTTIATTVSYPVDTPKIEIFTKDTFRHALEKYPQLMFQLKLGVFEELVSMGFAGDLCGIDQYVDYNSESLRIVDDILRSADLLDGKTIYYISRALCAKGLLDADQKEDVVQKAEEVEKINWIPSFVPAVVAQGLFGNTQKKKDVYLKGEEWVTSSTRVKAIGGWAMLAASASTEDERRKAYALVMQDIDTRWIDMSANVPIAAAILANEDQRKEIYIASSQKYEETNYWTIKGGNLIAMAITASEGEERSKVYQIAIDRLRQGYNYRYTHKDILVMALTAQTQEEKNRAYMVAEEYSNSKKYKNSLIGWAVISLGILGCRDRELAIKCVAALMEIDEASF